MAEVAVLGLGYVGITSVVGLAKLGHHVLGLDIDLAKISSLKKGIIPVHEPRLSEVYLEELNSGKIRLSSSYEDLSGFSGIVMVCVSTPTTEQGGANLEYIESAVASLIKVLSVGSIICVKSTVPIGTCETLSRKLEPYGIRIASNPEFLAEGSALEDFLVPSRIIVGAESNDVAASVMGLYESILAPRLVADLSTSESIKYASNAFLALKLSFVNEIASLSERTGADTAHVLYGMSLDERIGSKFLNPGPGWGGSCFPKDTREIVFTGRSLGAPLLTIEAAIDSNANQIRSVSNAVIIHLGEDLTGIKLAIWGLAFKSNTDDTRDSPSLEVTKTLSNLGAEVVVYDPLAKGEENNWLKMVESPLVACEGASALLVLTEWAEFSEVDPDLVKKKLTPSPLIFDTRRVLDPKKWSKVFSNFKIVGQR
jgi:UDPglucose 6-dehydrogenase